MFLNYNLQHILYYYVSSNPNRILHIIFFLNLRKRDTCHTLIFYLSNFLHNYHFVVGKYVLKNVHYQEYNLKWRKKIKLNERIVTIRRPVFSYFFFANKLDHKKRNFFLFQNRKKTSLGSFKQFIGNYLH